MSLFVTFNKYTPYGVSSFSIHHFHVSIWNQLEWKQVYIRTFERKQTKKERRKENHRRKTNCFFFKVCNVLSKILHYIRKYFVSDVQPHSITWRSKMIWKASVRKWSGKWVFVTGRKDKEYNILLQKTFQKKIMHNVTTYKWSRQNRPR